MKLFVALDQKGLAVLRSGEDYHTEYMGAAHKGVLGVAVRDCKRLDHISIDLILTALLDEYPWRWNREYPYDTGYIYEIDEIESGRDCKSDEEYNVLYNYRVADMICAKDVAAVYEVVEGSHDHILIPVHIFRNAVFEHGYDLYQENVK